MPSSPTKLPLPFGDAPASRARPAGDAAQLPPAGLPACHDGGRLWLCLHFPRLPLEVLAGHLRAPCAVLAGEKKPAVLLCDDAATRRGVRPGMPVNAALALVPELELRSREQDGERDVLDDLAAWAQRFTPVVSPDPSGALLLEIAASLRLFGSPDALRAAALTGARERGHAVLAAVAPAARAALWLARSGQEAVITTIAHLPGVLARLPLGAPGWPQPVERSLRRMGVKRLGDCMRLPRDGLARRIGAACLAEMDEALGRRPELHSAWRRDTRFHSDLELPAETRETGHLVAALRILLQRLDAHLRLRQAGARVLWVSLRHRGAPLTPLRLGLLRPSADVRHLEELAVIHLATVVVPAPVAAITLEADVAEAPPDIGADLLGREPDAGERMAALVERLRMRLGAQAVHGIRVRPGHRPEHAWQAVPDPADRRPPGATRTPARRPLWILERPAALGMRSGAPLLDGLLALEGGPERIETGWWDDGDVRRDYYVARNPRGVRAWVFNDRRAGGWYLHGLFG